MVDNLAAAIDKYNEIDRRKEELTQERAQILSQLDNTQKQFENAKKKNEKLSGFYERQFGLSSRLQEIEIELEKVGYQFQDAKIDVDLLKNENAKKAYPAAVKEMNKLFEAAAVSIYSSMIPLAEYIRKREEVNSIRSKLDVIPDGPSEISFNHELTWKSLDNALEAMEFYHSDKLRKVDIPRGNERIKLIQSQN